jgi:hypothetical protein
MNEKFEKIRTFVKKSISNRDHVAPNMVPSKYWTDFARNFRYVYDMNHDELMRIRYHTYHLTSDLYLTYYFANDNYKNLLISGYLHFVEGAHIVARDEGVNGIGVETDYGRISHDLLRYLGVVYDLIKAKLIDRSAPKTILEIGGGYGGLARANLVHNPQISYVICDLEETIFYSAIYLTSHFGKNQVHLVESDLDNTQIKHGHIYIVPQHQIRFIDKLHFDLAISQQSLQEMTFKQVDNYLLWVKNHVNFLYSCNISDHAFIAKEKDLVLNLYEVLETFYSDPIWRGSIPDDNKIFGDHHLMRTVYQCH